MLGDSYMQGMFIGDDDTPPECLRRYLEKERKTRVSLANGGVMGYSPEQYYYTMLALAERIRPHFVVVSVCANDFGNFFDAVSKGVADWKEGKYWLEKIAVYCKKRRWPCLFVMVPPQPALMVRRNSGYFPGLVINNLDVDSRLMLDPMDDFLNAHLRLRVEAERRGETPKECLLFNYPLNDYHFFPAGSVVWAESVGRRVLLLLDDVRLYDRSDDRAGGTPRPVGEGPT